MSSNVNNKRDFVKRYKQGEFGNSGWSWLSIHDWIACPHGHGIAGWNGPRLFHLRNRIIGGPTFYNLTVNQVMSTISHKIPKEEIDNYYVSEMAPHQTHGTIQGNVMLGDTGQFILEWLPCDIPMRDAEAKYGWTLEKGLRAKALIQHHMNSMSYGWLNELLENYPDHVVEFSCFSKCWGRLRGHNTAFWEVRLY